MRKGIAALAAVALGLAVSASEGEVNYRQHTMSAIGGHMQAIVDILRGDVPHTDHAAVHANALADLAGLASTLFPEGSGGGDALGAIWEDPEDFQAKLSAFREAADSLKAAAPSGDRAQLGAAVQGVGQACKGCHDSYRAE